MPFDPFRYQTGDPDDPAGNAFAVTPHNTTDFTAIPRSLYIGGAGDVVAVFSSGAAITFVGVPAGSILPVRCTRVNSTGTTATSIVGLL